MFEKRVQHLIMRNIIPLNADEKRAIQNGPKIFANSMPKSGTHLLRHILAMMPGVVDRWTYHYADNVVDYKKQLAFAKGGQIISSHIYWGEGISKFLQQNNFKTFFVVRDLRDVCVSGAHYCATDTRHRLYRHFSTLPCWQARLAATINGIAAEELSDGVRSKSIAEHIEGYLPWIGDESCMLVKFEDLVGAKGGGSEEKQILTIKDISNHLGLRLSNSELENIIENSFSKKTKTFRKGQIGAWRNEYSRENIKLFKKVAGNQLVKLGYETDNTW